MIIKNKGWKFAGGFKRLSSYIWQGATEDGQTAPSLTSMIWHNVKEDVPENVAKEMRMAHNNRRYTGKNYNSLHHAILSWHPEDREVLTEDIVYHLASQYIEERCPYAKVFGGIHKEKDHFHVHLLFCNTLEDGTSMRMGKGDFEISKNRMHQYQRKNFPNIKHSYEAEAFLEKKANGQYDTVVKKDYRALYEQEKRKAGDLSAHREVLLPVLKKHTDIVSFLRECSALGYEPHTTKASGLRGLKVGGQSITYSKLFLDKDDRKKFTRTFGRQYESYEQRLKEQAESMFIENEYDDDSIDYEWDFD